MGDLSWSNWIVCIHASWTCLKRPTQASEDLTHDLLGSWTWQTRTQTSSLAILEASWSHLETCFLKKNKLYNISNFHISCIHFSYHQPHLTHPFFQPTTDTKVVWLTAKPSRPVGEPDLIRSSMIFVCPSCSFLREATKHFSLDRFFFLGGGGEVSDQFRDIRYLYV